MERGERGGNAPQVATSCCVNGFSSLGLEGINEADGDVLLGRARFFDRGCAGRLRCWLRTG